MEKLSGIPLEELARVREKYHLGESRPVRSTVLIPPESSIESSAAVRTLPVIPFEGIGPLKLGMTPEETAGVVSRLCTSWSGPGFCGVTASKESTWVGEICLRYTSQDSEAVFLIGYRDGCAVDILVNCGIRSYASVMLDGLDLFRTAAVSLVTALKGRSALVCDMQDEDLSYRYWFRDIGVFLEREENDHPNFEFVRVTEKGRRLF